MAAKTAFGGMRLSNSGKRNRAPHDWNDNGLEAKIPAAKGRRLHHSGAGSSV